MMGELSKPCAAGAMSRGSACVQGGGEGHVRALAQAYRGH